jgi:hypothetical protein
MNEKINSQEASALEYFHALRNEILEAQKLRVQVGLAKTVFLGTLLGFFFKDAKGSSAILVSPFIALMFDCMVYGLSFNIREIGNYIADHIERYMPFSEPWETHRGKRSCAGYKDWGRRMFRVGSYGLSISVAVVSFVEAYPPAGPRALPYEWSWRLALILLLFIGWAILIWAEWSTQRPKQLAHR